MAWRRPGDKPLSETMMVSLPTHICITQPQGVNTYHIFSLLYVSNNVIYPYLLISLMWIPAKLDCMVPDTAQSMIHVYANDRTPYDLNAVLKQLVIYKK